MSVAAEKKGDRVWHRSLKNDRIEAYAALDGTFVHIIARPSVAQELLGALEDATGKALPSAELRPTRGRRRGPRPLDGQTQFDDTGEAGV